MVDRVLVVLVFFAVLLASALLLTYPFGRDQGIFAVIGEGILRGKVPYRDLWDVKTPGIFMVFALAEALFGHTMVGPRIIEVIALLATCAILVDLGRRFFADALSGYLGAAILAIVHSQFDFWHTSQPETYAGMFLVWAAWLTVAVRTTAQRAELRQRPWRFLLAGALLGCIAWFKPHLALVAPLFLWAIGTAPGVAGSLRRRWLCLGYTLFGVATVILLGVAVLVAVGAWDAALWTWRDFAPGYARIGTSLAPAKLASGFYSASSTLFVQLSALVAIGLILFLCLRNATTTGVWYFNWLTGLAILFAFVVFLQQKSFRYHYAAALPVLALAAGSGWALSWRLATRHGWRYAGLFLSAFGAAYFMRVPVTDLTGTTTERAQVRLARLWGGAKSRKKQALHDSLYVVRKDFDLTNAQAVASWANREIGPNDTLLVWGCDSIIYWLSEREPATRFIHNIPQRSPWQARTAREIFMRDLNRQPPKAVIVQRGDIIKGVTGEPSDSAGSLAGFPELARFLDTSYRRGKTIGKFDVFVR
jgi:hypothetical protein